jgi:glycosyltransferase involved in cell wall biosynthesis
MKFFKFCIIFLVIFCLLCLTYTFKDQPYHSRSNINRENPIAKSGSENINNFYSIVIPLKNEEGNIESLINELESVMTSLKVDWELICIDDGSEDTTGEILRKLAKTRSYMVNIFFDNNYGQSSALNAGFKAAKGNLVITLDGDGQNDPADIPKLIPLMKHADLVCGIRVTRKDDWHKRYISKIANRVRNWLLEDGVHDTGCSLRIYRKACLDQIKMYDGMHRFLPALFNIEGFRVTEIPVNHRERTKGVSNYNFFNRSFNVLFDVLAVYWMKNRKLQHPMTSNAELNESSY